MIPNLRDVGETINILCGKEVLADGLLFRGGTVNEVFGPEELPRVNCILNLRNGKDRTFDGIRQIHIPRTYTNEVYNTRNGNVRNWLNSAVSSICLSSRFPLLVHCTGGKDRTGVFIALLLLAIGIELEYIVEDYMLSEGNTELPLIDQAITGIGDPAVYLYDVNAVGFLTQQLRRGSS